MIIIDEKVLDKYRGPHRCALCGHGKQNCSPHHIQARRLGGGHRLDIHLNLVPLDLECHSLKADSAEGRDKCIRHVCIRERCTPEDRQAVIDFLNRLDGKASPELIAEILVRDLTGRAFELAEAALITAGKLKAAK